MLCFHFLFFKKKMYFYSLLKYIFEPESTFTLVNLQFIPLLQQDFSVCGDWVRVRGGGAPAFDHNVRTVPAWVTTHFHILSSVYFLQYKKASRSMEWKPFCHHTLGGSQEQHWSLALKHCPPHRAERREITPLSSPSGSKSSIISIRPAFKECPSPCSLEHCPA